MIVTCTDKPDDRRKADSFGARSFHRVTHCSTHDDFCECAQNAHARTFVVGMDVLVRSGSDAFMKQFSLGRDPCSLYVVDGLAPLEPRELALLARIEGDVRLVYRPYHDLELHLEERRPAGLPTATIAIFRRVGQRLGADVAEEFMCCVVIGKRRAARKRAASALSISTRTLNRRLRAAGLPKFDRLMATLRIAHAIYRLTGVGVDARDAAQSIGFRSRESFANFVSNHTGLCERALLPAAAPCHGNRE